MYLFIYWSQLVCGTGFPDCLAGKKNFKIFGVGQHEILQICVFLPKCQESLKVEGYRLSLTKFSKSNKRLTVDLSN